ncbi:ureidoglycolate lyase [Quatrionicoccus australiensis]|uniref:ureidoglycolate lyase n=1 Tax=Quatrionicoccus australiensis TaxID=138118 RepID=UPI001CFA65E7|nr:ureidoglycolate lyase [Quatrionicoccus australiensis]
MKKLVPEALTAAAFAPFGDVMAVDAAKTPISINGGNTERYHDLARLDAGPDGKLIVSIFRGQPRSLPFAVSMMERHPLGSQAFMPLGNQPYLVVVARPGPAPGPDDLRAFLAQPGQGVNYATGVWHHPLLALNEIGDFLVVDRSGPGNNCDEVSIEPPVSLSLD